MTLWSTVFCYKNCRVPCLMKNARLRCVHCCSCDLGVGGGQQRPSLYNRLDVDMGVHPLHIMLIPISDVNALYIFDGAVTGSSYVAESGCYINTSELTNRGSHCTSMFQMPQIATVDQMPPFRCRIAHLWPRINIDVLYITDRKCIFGRLRTGTRIWKDDLGWNGYV